MATSVPTSVESLAKEWPNLSRAARVNAFAALPQGEMDDLFLQLGAREQAELTLALPQSERRIWVRLLAPDDAADVVQTLALEERESLLSVLDSTRREVTALMAYKMTPAGG